ncbi:RNA-directed DNA polymerase, eukaryota [Tanacetum coccineum]
MDVACSPKESKQTLRQTGQGSSTGNRGIISRSDSTYFLGLGFRIFRSRKKKAGGSILEVIDDMIKVGQSMGFTMEGCLGSKAKKDWIKELNNKHKVNFLSVQETKLDCISDMDVKVLWGNYKFEYTISEAVGNSGGILCVWDPSVFRKEHHVVSDNFVALYGSWVSNQAKLLVVSIYAPQSITSKRSLWSYISSLISRWDGHCMVMGDFNEVRCMEDRLGSVYNAQAVFRRPAANRCKLNYTFPNRLSSDQLDMLESPISRDEVRNVRWWLVKNKSPGPRRVPF